MKLHSARSSSGRGGPRKPPLAFPERGAVMAAAVVNTPVAVAASLAVVRAFVRLRGDPRLPRAPPAGARGAREEPHGARHAARGRVRGRPRTHGVPGPEHGADRIRLPGDSASRQTPLSALPPMTSPSEEGSSTRGFAAGTPTGSRMQSDRVRSVDRAGSAPAPPSTPGSVPLAPVERAGPARPPVTPGGRGGGGARPGDPGPRRGRPRPCPGDPGARGCAARGRAGCRGPRPPRARTRRAGGSP